MIFTTFQYLTGRSGKNYPATSDNTVHSKKADANGGNFGTTKISKILIKNFVETCSNPAKEKISAEGM